GRRLHLHLRHRRDQPRLPPAADAPGARGAAVAGADAGAVGDVQLAGVADPVGGDAPDAPPARRRRAGPALAAGELLLGPHAVDLLGQPADGAAQHVRAVRPGPADRPVLPLAAPRD